MPELPEIEHLRRTLGQVVIGSTVTRVRLDRADIIRRTRGTVMTNGNGHASSSAIPRPRLLRGEQIIAIDRRGKELALIGDSGRALAIHLGMSGQLLLLPAGQRLDDPRHVHCTWWLGGEGERHRLVFRDPRRFGGLWPIDSHEQLTKQHWARLGPDALAVSVSEFRARLRATRRAIKAALLDQRLIAGVGNIYADESLHAASIHPLTPACALDDVRTSVIHRAVRRILRHAIDAGGSTIRDYRDGRGNSGTYAFRHRVYGRSGQPCLRCGAILQHTTIAQRTTTFCPGCQPACESAPA